MNHRWDVTQDLRGLVKRQRKVPSVLTEDFVFGTPAAEPELNLKVALRGRGLDNVTVHGILDHSWPLLDVEDAEITLSLFELCQVYGPAIAPVLKLNVCGVVGGQFMPSNLISVVAYFC